MELAGAEDDLADRRLVVTAAQDISSYAMAVPAGWVHIPIGDRASMLDVISSVVEDTADNSWRASIGSLFDTAIASDPNGRLLDTYMTQGPLSGTAIAASITVARVEVVPSDDHGVEELLLARLTRDGARVRSIGGSVGVVSTTLGDSERAVEDSAEVLARETALLQVPGQDAFVLALVFNVVTDTGGDRPGAESERNVVRALSDLFDAMLGTFRWIDHTGAVVPPAEAHEAW